MSNPVNLPTVPPQRGGIHTTYGIFIGGAQLDDTYHLLPNRSAYRFSTQRRHEKTIASIEQKLRDARDSVTTVKFNGQLEATAGLSTDRKRKIHQYVERKSERAWPTNLLCNQRQ